MPLPDDVEARDLDPDARKELRSLTKEAAELVARHLVMTGRLLDDDPQQALAHARAARAMAARIGVVREAVGLAAYANQQWTEALAELRAARRITGRPEHLAVLADCERALGRPERALAFADDPDVPGLPQDERVELVIVLAGARADMGQVEAAVLTVQEPARRTTASRPWAARLWYAYADLLLAAGRGEEAREWFARTAEIDAEAGTDAADRVLELDGVVLEDLGDEESDAYEESLPDQELADYISRTYTASRVQQGSQGEMPIDPPVEVEPAERNRVSIPEVEHSSPPRAGLPASTAGEAAPPPRQALHPTFTSPVPEPPADAPRPSTDGAARKATAPPAVAPVDDRAAPSPEGTTPVDAGIVDDDDGPLVLFP